MSKIVNIKHEAEKTTLSKAQKKFNTLIKKIETQKQILQTWENSKPKISQRLHGEYQPLVEKYTELRVATVYLLDEAHGNSFFKKTDKAKLKALINDLAIDLIQEGVEELKEIYNRHTDIDTNIEDRTADMNDMFGIDLGDEMDFSSPEKMHETLLQKMQAEQDRQEAKRAKRKKSVKQLEKEAREKEEAQQVSKSIQEVFRKLVAVLHPDREPDEAERERKTKLMQRVNEAYGKKDLLQLLALQLEIEQIDQSQINTIAEDKLKHFNKILQDQLDELEQEIHEVEFPFRMQLNTPPYSELAPEQVLKALSRDIKGLQQIIKDTEKDLKDFQNPANLKAVLKNYRL